jgi:hypothetical protein
LQTRKPGFFLVAGKSESVLFFHCAVNRRSWVLPIGGEGRERCLSFATNLAEIFVPIDDFVAGSELENADAEVYWVEVEVAGATQEEVRLRPAKATAVD